MVVLRLCHESPKSCDNNLSIEVVACRIHINIIFRVTVSQADIPKLVHLHLLTFLMSQMDRVYVVCIDRISLIHMLKRLLQVDHQFDLRVESSHIADSLLEVYSDHIIRIHDD